MSKVSVIMPVYNAQSYLQTSLDSLLSQTLMEIEIICVDDGSTDNSLSILKRYQEKDNRITILSQKNSYAGAARNYGMTVATGEYLSFLDADDYFKSDMLKKSYECAILEKADVVVFGGELFYGDLEEIKPFPALLNETLLPRFTGSGFDNKNKIENIMNFTTPAPWNKLFRREFIEQNKLRFQTCKRVNDAYFVHMALVLSEKIGIVHENLICYRTGNKNSLQGSNNETPKHFAEVLLDIRDRLIELKLFESVEKSFRNLCLSNCLYTLESLTEANAFKLLYKALQDEIFEKFHIVGTPETDYYNSNAYKEYIYIRSHTPIDYLMKKCKNSKRIGLHHLFPFNRIEKENSFILYGAGKVGRSFYYQIRKLGYGKMIDWVDIKEEEYDGYPICSPENANWGQCDFVIIAIEKESVAENIKMTLQENYHIPSHKIIWENPLI